MGETLTAGVELHAHPSRIHANAENGVVERLIASNLGEKADDERRNSGKIGLAVRLLLGGKSLKSLPFFTPLTPNRKRIDKGVFKNCAFFEIRVGDFFVAVSVAVRSIRKRGRGYEH